MVVLGVDWITSFLPFEDACGLKVRDNLLNALSSIAQSDGESWVLFMSDLLESTTEKKSRMRFLGLVYLW